MKPLSMMSAVLAICSAAGEVDAQSLDTGAFNAAPERGRSNPSIMSPPVQRSDMLAAVFELDPTAVTAETLVTYYAISGTSGCRDLLMMQREISTFNEVLTRAVGAGVSVRTSISVSGNVGFEREGLTLIPDQGDMLVIVPPPVDSGPCGHRRVGIIEEFSVRVPELPPITPGPSRIDQLEVSIARIGRSCVQLSGRLIAHALSDNGYGVELDVDTVRVGSGVCGGTLFSANMVARGPDPHLFDNYLTISGSNTAPVETLLLRDYALSALRQEDGSWLWGVEDMQLTAEGFPVGNFEPLVRR